MNKVAIITCTINNTESMVNASINIQSLFTEFSCTSQPLNKSRERFIKRHVLFANPYTGNTNTSKTFVTSRVRINIAISLMLKAEVKGSVKRMEGMNCLLFRLPPEPDPDRFKNDILKDLRSGHPVKAEVLRKLLSETSAELGILKILDKNSESESLTDSLKDNQDEHKVHEQASRQGNNFFYQSHPKPDQGGEKMVREIPFLVRDNICRMLDVRRLLGGDYKTLAGEIGMSSEDIKFISQSKDATENVLSWWETQSTATVQTLREILKRMKRDDVVDVLEGKTGDESGRMVRKMAYPVRNKICRMLNARRPIGGDFKELAGEVGISNDDIKRISDADDPAEEVLAWWDTQKSATMKALQLKLVEMKRDDIVEVLREDAKASRASYDNCGMQLSRFGEEIETFNCSSDKKMVVFSFGEILKALEASGLLKRAGIGWYIEAENSRKQFAPGNNDVSSIGIGEAGVNEEYNVTNEFEERCVEMSVQELLKMQFSKLCMTFFGVTVVVGIGAVLLS